MNSARKTNRLAVAWRGAACLVIAAGAGATACLAGPAAPPAPSLSAQGALPPAVIYAQAGPERGITKAQFIERRRQKAASQGQNPEEAAARAARIFDMVDTNHDGIMSRAEIDTFRAAHPGIGQGQGQGQGPPPPR